MSCRCYTIYFLLGFVHFTHAHECSSALGMEDGRIKNSQISVSSVKKGTTAAGQQARLRNNKTIWAAWCPENNGATGCFDQYIEIDLLHLTTLTRIETQGREYKGGTEFVKKYKVSYSKDGCNWIDYRGSATAKADPKIFKGNTDVKSVVINNLNPAITTRYLRIHPDYDKLNLVCMRLELYGCVAKELFFIIIRNYPKAKIKNEKTIAAIVGVSESLLAIFIVLMAIQMYRRRRQASQPDTLVRIELENVSTGGTSRAAQIRETTENGAHQQDVEQESGDMIPATAKTPTNTQTPTVYTDLDIATRHNSLDDDNYHKLLRESEYVIPAEGDTYEVVHDTAPPGYTPLDSATRQGPVNEETTDGSYQQLVKPASGYAILAERNTNEEVQGTTLPGDAQLDSATRPGTLEGETNGGSYQQLVKPGSGYVIPAEGDIYEDVHDTAPPGYTQLDSATRRGPLEGETTNGSYQQLVTRESGYVIPAEDDTYEEVHDTPPPGYTQLDSATRQGPVNEETTDGGYQQLVKRESGYVIPAPGNTEAPYENVQVITPSGYTELDKNKRVVENETNGAHQKPLKNDEGYVIPHDSKPIPNEVQIAEHTSGYTELDITKRELDDNNSYQKLVNNK